MEKYLVHIYFEPQSFVVSAKNKADAKAKIYKKLSDKTALKYVNKKETDIED